MRQIPWWFWPNVLSLDAPIVAVAWLWIFSADWRVDALNPAFFGVLAGMIWVIYVADRWHDSRRRDPLELGERHDFHRRNGRWLLGLAGFVGIACAALFFLAIPFEILWIWPPPDSGWDWFLHSHAQV